MDLSRGHALGRSAGAWVAAQVFLVALGVLLYFSVRGLTESSVATAREHAQHLVSLEKWLHIYVEPTIQQPVRSRKTVEAVANWIYIWGHWPVLITTMVWLVRYHRQQFLRLRDAMLVSGGLGMIVFVSYPMAPPRLAGLGSSTLSPEAPSRTATFNPRPS